MLLSPAQTASVLGMEVVAEAISMENIASACRYSATDETSQAIFLITIRTVSPLQEPGKAPTIAEWYEQERAVTLRTFGQISAVEIQDIPDLGEKAYYTHGTMMTIYVLKDDVEYVFNTVSPKYEGRVTLENLKRIAEQAISDGK